VNERRILYETSLAKTGATLTRGAVVVMLLFVGFGLLLVFGTGTFPSGASALVWVGICVVAFSFAIRRFLRLRRNPGIYQISIDSYGLYVHCDAPDFAPAFSVVATDISYLVRKTIKQFESSDEYEYYVETKSGRRYRIEEGLLCRPPFKVMDLFDEITNYFPRVEIKEESQSF
jgi:hypothetical protein